MKTDGWRARAACLTHEPELFFPVGTTGPAEAQVDAAQQVCLSCPVRENCLQWAFDHHIDHGVWGGLSETQRRSLRRRTARRASMQQAHLTPAPVVIRERNGADLP